MQPTGDTKHMPRLDSLRGVAALMVAGYHALASNGSNSTEQSIAALLGYFFDGRIGVSIFFVLSGLVLGMSLRRAGALTSKGYAHFCVRRFFRLYPAYLVSSLFYLALYFLVTTRLQHGEPIGAGYSHYDSEARLTTAQLLENFLFLHQALNHATWTLKVEVIAAILLPFLHQYSRCMRWKGQVVLLLALTGLAFLPSSQPTRMCLFLFYGGYLIPPFVDRMRMLQLQKGRLPVLFFLVAVFAFTVSHICPLSDEGRRWGTFFAGSGSVLILCLILIDSPHQVFKVLDHAALRHLGAVSYSFYLLNLFCLDIVLRCFSLMPLTRPLALNPTLMSSTIIFACATLLCVGLSTLSYRWIERPAIKLGAHFYRP